MFDYDWFFGSAYKQQKVAAKFRVAGREFPDIETATAMKNERFKTYMDSLECRTLLYLRDGFSYEVKGLVSDVESKTHLTFECEPLDEVYKVGSFLVSTPFEEIARVETFAVHPDKKPENTPMITGFRGSPHEEPKSHDSREKQ